MGNGQAPGTEIGRGATGVDISAMGIDATGAGDAGLAVFFFAAFFTAGFLAGFFLPAVTAATGFLAAGAARAERLDLAAFFLPAADDFPARLALADAFFLAGFGAAFDFTEALRRARLAATPLGAAFFFAAPFFADFFLTAMRTSVC